MTTLASEASNGKGVAKDGNNIVIDVESYTFPNRCLITDEPVNNGPHSLTLYRLRFGIQIDSLEKQTSVWSMGPLELSTVKLQLPLQDRFRRHTSYFAISLLIVGFAIIPIGAMAGIYGAFNNLWPLSAAAIPIPLGLVISLIGIRILVRQHRPLYLYRKSGNYVWLSGVHQNVLGNLPPWKNSTPEQALLRKSAFAQLVISVIAFAIAGLLLEFRYEEMFDVFTSRSWIPAPGTVTHAHTSTTSVGGGNNLPKRTAYKIELVYTFQVRGAMYSGSRITFGQPRTYHKMRFAEDDLKRQYPVGGPVTVFYSPQSPNRSSLSKSTPIETLWIVGPFPLALSVGIIALASSLFKMRATASSKPKAFDNDLARSFHVV